MLGRLRGLLLGRPKNLLDPLIHQRIALIAFFAWVGLGSDGLSSSSYGPEEAYLQLHGHHHLALYLMFAMVGTVFLISASYTQMIELFPSGGGGYLVGTKLLGPVPGLVSGCALIVDYTLTIAISVAAGRKELAADELGFDRAGAVECRKGGLGFHACGIGRDGAARVSQRQR